MAHESGSERATAPSSNKNGAGDQSSLNRLWRTGLESFEKLIERTKLLEELIDNFPGGLSLFDREFRMVLCNEQQKQLLDYPEDLFANGFPTLEDVFRFNAERGEYGSGDIEQHVSQRMDLVRKREPHQYERERPNGTVVQVRGMPMASGGFVTTYLDVTEQRQRTRQLEALLENFPGGIALFNKDLEMVLYNNQLISLLEYPDNLFANGLPRLQDIFRFNAERGEYGPGDIEEHVRTRIALVEKREPHDFERERPNGSVLQVRGVPLEGGGFVTTYIDVTEQRQRARQLEALVANFPGGISLFDENLNMVLCNDRLKELLEYPDTMFEKGLPTLEQLFSYNAQRGEYGDGNIDQHVNERMELVRQHQSHAYERVRPNGTTLEVRGEPLSGKGFVTTYLDVTEQRRNQALIAHMAHHDNLTDLPNRLLFRDRLEQALTMAKRGVTTALLFLDLDKFKPVNDTHGHAVGDKLLQSVAERLLGAVRESDTVARLGGDEFAVILVGIGSRSGAAVLCNRIIDELSQVFKIDDCEVQIGASIGIAMAPSDSAVADELLKLADAALYKSKEAGRGTYSFADQR